MPSPNRRKKVYKSEFAKELKNGLRKDHTMSIEKVCQHWGTTRSSYNNWKRDIKEFSDACEVGDQDYQVACVQVGWDLATGKMKGNAVVYCMLMSCLHNMSTKTESKVVHEEQIQTININVLGREKQPLVIEAEPEKPKKITAFQKFLEQNKEKAVIEHGE